MHKQTFSLVSITIATLAMGSVAACHRGSGNEKRYDLKGKVIAVEKDKRLITIEHGDIKGYMPGMTMPFMTKQDADLEIVRPGDQVTATLVVDGAASWLDDVVVTKQNADPNFKAADGPSVAQPGDLVPN